jgi:hypothetical protein
VKTNCHQPKPILYDFYHLLLVGWNIWIAMPILQDEVFLFIRTKKTTTGGKEQKKKRKKKPRQLVVLSRVSSEWCLPLLPKQKQHSNRVNCC